MVVLAIDTCEQKATIELNINGKIFKEQLTQQESTSENLLVKIESLLLNAGANVSNINLLGVCTGPGSFTGVRIAISCIKGLACGLQNVTLQGVNTFEKIAYKNNINTNAIIVLNSGNADVYYAVLEKNKTKLQFKEYGAKSATEILNIQKQTGYKIYALKNEEEQLKNYFKISSLCFVENESKSISEMAIYKTEKYGGVDINNLFPLYIKQSQAERELKQLVKEKSEIKKPLFVQDLLDIENECFTHNKFTEKMFEEELSLATRKYFVTYYKGKPIAYMGLMQIENELCLLKVAVLPEFRRLGLAKKLLNKAIELKNENNADVFYLEVNSNNSGAIAFYQNLGFKVKHERKNYYENGDSCLTMFYEA